MQIELDTLDRAILNILQWEFPLTHRPFLSIAERLNVSEDDIISRVKALKDSNIIREIDAIFDTRALKYKSALVAMSVEPSRIEDIAYEINRHPGVSHNYERDHYYNLWFTIAVPPYGNVKREVERFLLQGVREYMILPTVKLYKIGVRLDMLADDEQQEVRPAEEVKSIQRVDFEASEEDKRFIREMQKDIDVVREPFSVPASRLGVSVDAYIEKMRYYQSIGVMRRFAAILRHRNAGFIANGMIVWIVPEERIDEVGFRLASYPQVSHCYRRPVYPSWPYNLYTMVHARSRDVCESIASEMSAQVGIKDYTILFSTREFKKERVRYYLEDEYQLT